MFHSICYLIQATNVLFKFQFPTFVFRPYGELVGRNDTHACFAELKHQNKTKLIFENPIPTCLNPSETRAIGVFCPTGRLLNPFERSEALTFQTFVLIIHAFRIWMGRIIIFTFCPVKLECDSFMNVNPFLW